MLATVALIGIVATCERRFERRWRPLGASRGQVVFPEASRAIAARAAGRHALVVSAEFSGALRFYTDLSPVRWEWFNAEDFIELRLRAAERREPIFAVLLASEIPKAVTHVPGRVEVPRERAWRQPLGAAASVTGSRAAQRPGCAGSRPVSTASGGGVPPSR